MGITMESVADMLEEIAALKLKVKKLQKQLRKTKPTRVLYWVKLNKDHGAHPEQNVYGYLGVFNQRQGYPLKEAKKKARMFNGTIEFAGRSRR